MTLNVHNPYQGAGTRWLRGEIHAHVNKARDSSTKYHDGFHAEKIYKHAQEAELNFVCMSVDVTAKKGGVNRFGDVGSGDECEVTGIPAREIQNNYYKHYFSEDGADYLHILTLGERNGISLCAHPLYYEIANPKPHGCWKDIKQALLHQNAGENLEALNVSGLEIYNGFTMRTLMGKLQHGQYTDCFEEKCWDELLTEGRRYWGFAGNDAFFHEHDHFRSFIPQGVVYAQVDEGRTPEDIIAALRLGRFYSSTGVKLAETPLEISIDDSMLRIRVSGAERLTWKGKVHQLVGDQWELNSLPSHTAVSAEFTVEGDWRYVRVQCERVGASHERAWLQPITNRKYFKGLHGHG